MAFLDASPDAASPFTDGVPGDLATVRRPRAWLVIGNGTPINLLECEVHLVRLGQASTFSVSMALDDPTAPDESIWATQSGKLPASILATNDDAGESASTAVELISGAVDKAEVDYRQRTVHVSGRDLVGSMIDTRNDQKYPNTPTAEVVSQIAGKHGLQFFTDGGTNMAGTTYDGQDYAYNTDEQNDWDTVHQCAHQDGKVCFVNGNTLYYVSPGSVVGSSYLINYAAPTAESYETGNAIDLKVTNDLGLGVANAGVASWSQYTKQPNTAGSIGDGQGQMYKRTPGLTQNQVDNVQARDQRQAAEKQFRVEVSLAGDVSVQPTMMLALSGTAFDQRFYMETVEHQFSFDSGYRMEISAKNGAPGAAGDTPEAGDAESPPEPSSNEQDGDTPSGQ
jgi:phage protein D